MNIISLEEAASYIKQSIEEGNNEGQSPFFFIVGAGISNPPIPLAKEIEQDCCKKAKELDRKRSSDMNAPIDTYSDWFRLAYQDAKARQRYLRNLIERKPLSHASLRLAHLLLEKKISNLVVTPNFDDFIARALRLFGADAIICDHPKTVERINPEEKDLQIVHVHGTYWFYDCCNLRAEIEDRAHFDSDSTNSMKSLLNHILWSRSPLVVGYSGWEGDVIMSALKQRLDGSRLQHNLFWFCHRHTSIEYLPNWLKKSNDVCFVMPKNIESDGRHDSYQDSTRSPKVSTSDDQDTKNYLSSAGESKSELELSAKDIFEYLIKYFDLNAPKITSDPLNFFTQELERSLIQDETRSDIYFFADVLKRIRRARTLELAEVNAEDPEIEKFLDHIRKTQFEQAIATASQLVQHQRDQKVNQIVVDGLETAVGGLKDSPVVKTQGYDLIVHFNDVLIQQDPSNVLSHFESNAWALLSKGFTLGQLGKSEEAIKVYDEVEKRFGKREELVLLEQVATALFNKGYRLGLLGKSEEAIKVYEEVVKRFGKREELVLLEQVAKALVNKGYRLGKLGKAEEEIKVYDEVDKRFGQREELDLLEQVARALFNKGVTLGQLGKSEEAIKVYDEVEKRFGKREELVLLEQVATALANKGYRLGELGKSEEEIKVYDEVVKRFGKREELVLLKQVVRALYNKGVTLRQLGKSEEAIKVYDEVVKRFGKREELALLEQVARALINKGVVLGKLGKSEEAINVYDEVEKRFGQREELPLLEQVAMALINKGIALGKLSKFEEAKALLKRVKVKYAEVISEENKTEIDEELKKYQ